MITLLALIVVYSAVISVQFLMAKQIVGILELYNHNDCLISLIFY
jgi:hypothetical protein